MKKRVLTLLLAVLLTALMVVAAGCGEQGTVGGDSAKPALILPKEIDLFTLWQQNQKQNENDFLDSGGWVYGQFWDKDGISQFVRAREDGAKLQILEDYAWAHFITEKDGTIYYALKQSPDPKKDGIYKMNADGSQKVKLAEAVDSMQICGEKIYYTDADKYHLYYMDFHGENKTEVLSKPVFYVLAFAEQILYQDDKDGETLHIYNLVTGKDTKVTDSISYCPVYDGEFIYYVKSETSASAPKNDEEWDDHMKGCSIWRIRPDGTCDALVSEHIPGGGIMINRHYIFFTDYENDSRVCRIDKDGENLKVLSKQTQCEALCFCDEYLKYTVRDKNGYIQNNYFCDIEGENEHPFKRYE